jgi:hypothetical protein
LTAFAASAVSAAVSVSFATSGIYTVTVKVYDNAGCSTVLVFTGQTASCNGSSAALASHAVKIT